MFKLETVFAQEPGPASGPVIDIGGWLEEIGNPFVWTGIDDIGVAVSTGVSIIITIAGLLFLVWFVWGAIDWLTSGGEVENVKKARDRITSAGVGLVLVLASWAIFMIVVHLFGLPFFEGEGVAPRHGCPEGTEDCCQIYPRYRECCDTPGSRIVGNCPASESDCFMGGFFCE